MKNLLKIGLLATLRITVVAVSCQKKDSTKNVAQDAQENDKLVKLADKYYETFLKLNPLEATSQGDLRFNDFLPDN